MEPSPREPLTVPRRVGRGDVLPVLFLAGSVLLLNALITAHRWVPAGQPLLALSPAAETAATVLIAVALARLGKFSARLIGLLWSVVLAVYIVFSASEALYGYFFQRHFEPWTDVPFIKGGILLLFGPMDIWLVPAMAVAIVLILGVGMILSWLCLRGLTGSGRDVIGARPLIIFAVAMLPIALLSAKPTEWLTLTMARSIARPTSDHVTGVIVVEEAPIDVPDSPLSKGFPGLAGGDIHLIIVESYGRSAFSRPELSQELEPLLRNLERELNAAGYGVVSGFLLSPVAGGYSWIADAAFLTGAPISNQTEYDAAIANGIATLPGIMADNGYFTLLSMPGTLHGDWPEARTFYRFEEVILAQDFDYVGPSFSFVPIPDQVAMAQAYQRLTEARTGGISRPAYIQHVLVSSHGPYSRIPPYISDWEQLGDGSLFYDLPIDTFDNDWWSGRQYDEGYVSAISYSLTASVRFLTRVVKEDAMAILVGDHQPGQPVRLHDAPKSVPIHIVAKQESVLRAFAEHGYVSGMVPNQAPPHKLTYTFLTLLLQIVRGLPPSDEPEAAPE